MDIPIIDRVFGMESGVVLNFSNRTFANFFHEELGVDIYDDRWAARGNSKANRLRCYLQRADRRTALHTLEAFWGYREASGVTEDYPELEDSVRTAYFPRPSIRWACSSERTHPPANAAMARERTTTSMTRLRHENSRLPVRRGPFLISGTRVDWTSRFRVARPTHYGGDCFLVPVC